LGDTQKRPVQGRKGHPSNNDKRPEIVHNQVGILQENMPQQKGVQKREEGGGGELLKDNGSGREEQQHRATENPGEKKKKRNSGLWARS